MKLALVLGLLGATTVSAAPYYVGENLHQQNAINLGFLDAPTKKNTVTGKTGNIAAFNLNGGFIVNENVGARFALPFVMMTKDATAAGSKSRNAIGNVSLGGGWNNNLQSADRIWNYGFSFTADVYVPTSQKTEAIIASYTNPTTDWFRYFTKATSATPTLGFFASRDTFSVKANAGLAYMNLRKHTVTGTKVTADGQTQANRWLSMYQLAGSWHAMPNLNANVEYNTILLDKKSAGTRAKFRHAITPSVSGNYEALLASAFVTIPLDSPTRDRTNVAFGINAGYSF